ncbi:MAG: hypothetical protein D6679_07560 [Candidatus Hydrogenedentota bacterium]|nr:MAG: hypothetical protein D6679_07560 [Candidatus Hydrogenedentota bacterium]
MQENVITARRILCGRSSFSIPFHSFLAVFAAALVFASPAPATTAAADSAPVNRSFPPPRSSTPSVPALVTPTPLRRPLPPDADFQDQIRLGVETSRDSLPLGDSVSVTITIATRGTPIIFDPIDHLPTRGLRLIGSRHEVLSEGAETASLRVTRFRFLFRASELGMAYLEPIRFRYRVSSDTAERILFSPQIGFLVIRGAEVNQTHRGLFIVGGITLLILFLLGGALFVLRRRSGTVEKEEAEEEREEIIAEMVSAVDGVDVEDPAAAGELYRLAREFVRRYDPDAPSFPTAKNLCHYLAERHPGVDADFLPRLEERRFAKSITRDDLVVEKMRVKNFIRSFRKRRKSQ